jgi:hypothetical protein
MFFVEIVVEELRMNKRRNSSSKYINITTNFNK